MQSISEFFSAPPPSYAPPQASCGQNLLVSCQPSVSSAPCSAYQPAYGPPAAYAAPQPAYRQAFNDEEGFVGQPQQA